MGFLIVIDRSPQQMQSWGMIERLSVRLAIDKITIQICWQESVLVTMPVSINIFIYVIIAVSV